MSAFIVSDKHINSLLNFAYAHMDGINLPDGQDLSFKSVQDLDKIGQILLDENYRSVNYRYREQEISHQIKFFVQPLLTPVQIIKACQCLDYQCCETEDWEETSAYRIINWIQTEAIRNLAGYEQAQWSIG
jgi:hypothetical protein